MARQSIEVRVSEEERKLLEAGAKAIHLKLSTFLRVTALQAATQAMQKETAE